MQPNKNGLPTIAKVGIGCGIVAIIAVIAAVIGIKWLVGFGQEKLVELVLKQNPEVEYVDMDKDKGTMTLRHKETGESYTVSFEDIKNGNLSIKGNDGNEVFSMESTGGGNGGVTINSSKGGQMQIGSHVDLSNVPDWVPLYPNTSKETSAMVSKNPQGKNFGTLAFDSNDSADQISAHFKAALENGGYSMNENQTSGKLNQLILSGNHPEESRTLNIVISDSGEKRALIINYEEK